MLYSLFSTREHPYHTNECIYHHFHTKAVIFFLIESYSKLTLSRKTMLIQHQYVWLKEQTLEQAITSSGDGLNPELK
jgi:hypothetical protein